jgi:ABC-type multidrug transport system fused ATPase/permease subunit
MQVPFYLTMEVNVDQGGFTQIPVWLVAFIASWITLVLVRRLGNRVSSSESRLADTLIDALSLLSAASVVASISATPLVSSLTASISRNLSSWAIADSIIITGGVILGIIVLIVGYLYMKTESKWWLFWFGVGIQVIALFVPVVNTILSWWINNPITWVWNFLIWVLTALPNITINF